jgi:excisionase family DNA binding protein
VEDLLTTRQLQDLLRVDRITIYRMLKDGRLRGFKVGGQWRFSRREIEAWLHEQQARRSWTAGPALTTEGPGPLPQILPTSCIRAIQAICAEAMGVAVVTTALDGTPLIGVSNSCGFCTLILATEAGQLRCAESWRRQSDGQVHSCHAGLLYASLPISVGGQPVAIAAACQFVALGPEMAEPAWQSHLPDLAASLSLSEADLRAAVGSVSVLLQSHLVRVPRLVRRIADTFSDLGQERLSLLGRLEKIGEMSRI